MQFWAVIVDSFRESLDRKIFWVLIALSCLIALVMLSVGFTGDKISFFFGLWETETEFYSPVTQMGPTRLVGAVVYFFLAALLGWIGIVLIIIATAGMFPEMMRLGAIDVVLSKPISRARLFLYKYISGMVFVAVQGAFFVVLTFLVMGLRWGVWRPGYLLSVPLLVLLFSYIFCVSVYVGVKTRSTVAAILLSIGAWALFAVVHQAPQVFETFPSLKEHAAVYHTIRVISWIPPKTGDFDYLAARAAGVGTSLDVVPMPGTGEGGAMTELDRQQLAAARDVEERQLLKDPVASIGSSLLFEAVVVLMAMWSFVRRDY